MTTRKTALPEISWVNEFNSNIPGLSHKTYCSKSMKRDIGFGIYLPPDYDALLDELNIGYEKKLLEGFIHVPTPYYHAEGLNGFKFHSGVFLRIPLAK